MSEQLTPEELKALHNAFAERNEEENKRLTAENTHLQEIVSQPVHTDD